MNRAKRKATARLISQIAFVLFIIGVFFGVKLFNLSLVVIALILWILNSTIASMLYPKRYTIAPEITSDTPPSGNKYCEVCGNQLEANAAFCSECGAKIAN